VHFGAWRRIDNPTIVLVILGVWSRSAARGVAGPVEGVLVRQAVKRSLISARCDAVGRPGAVRIFIAVGFAVSSTTLYK